MSYVVLDYETYYDKDYSLRKMTPVEYILDPRFEMIGCAVIDPDGGAKRARWLDGDVLTRYLRGLRQRKGLTVISHNALFDMCILYWLYGVLPTLMVDTMAMARAIIKARTGRVDLDACCRHLGLPLKDGNALVSGMHYADYVAAGKLERLAAYACQDAENCEGLFTRMAPSFPKNEYEIMDMVTRCAVVPHFKLNADMIAQHAAYLENQKQALLTRCGLRDRTELMSNDKFAAALRALGVEPDMKASPTTGELTYAFAKTDPFMIDLEDHPNPAVQALHAARIGHKSTGAETRAKRLMSISQLAWPDGSKGWAPIALNYAGAHTHRLSGAWKLNAQNWAKFTIWEDGTKTTGQLRLAHEAPPGHKVVKADAAQIEARIVAWLAGAEKLVQAFREKRDIYSEFAEEWIYHYPVSKATEDERFTGKGTILGAGFGMGPPRFKKNLAAVSYAVLGREINLDIKTAHDAIHGYRRAYPEVPEAWKQCEQFLRMMVRSGTYQEWGPIVVEQEAILLPSGLRLFYPELHYDPVGRDGKGSWVCNYAKKRKYLFGGKLYENIVQALARILTMEAARRMKRRFPQYPLAHQEHDALTYIVPDDVAPEFAKALEEEMATGLWWSAGLPLASEVGIGPNYGELK